jgi:putative aldouronate transport system permease protein
MANANTIKTAADTDHGLLLPKKDERNIRPIAIAGAITAFVGGFLPLIQSSNEITKFTPAYGFMNYEKPAVWYIFMLLLAVSVVLCLLKKEKFSIITTAATIPLILFAYNDVCSIHGAPGMMDGICVPVVIVGAVIGIVGTFIDIKKHMKVNREEVNYKYTGNKSIKQRMYEYRGFYLMFLPVLVFVVIFNYAPMLGLRYAFTDYKSGNEPVYVGIKNFVDMFGLTDLSKLTQKQFMQAFGNTLFISIIKLFLNTFAAVIISLLLNEMTHLIFKKSVQTLIYLPHFMSWVVVASIFKMFLSSSDSGLLNQVLMSLGIIDSPVNFLTQGGTWRVSYFLINLWKDTGWGTILFLATLSGISPDLYEAADIDGATRMQKMRYITLPALYNTIITVFILNLAKIMNLFESVFVMYNDSVLESSDVLQTYIYRQTFSAGTPNYGYTTAVGLFRSVVSCILVLICDRASKKVRGRGIV